MRKRKAWYAKACALRERGEKLAAIAKRFGVSRQRVAQVTGHVETPLDRHRKTYPRFVNHSTQPIPGARTTEPGYLEAQYYAQIATRKAIKEGRLIRQPCEQCGATTGRIEAHHEDYSKPLDVMWLCHKHHAQRHVELRKQRLAEAA